MREQARSSPPSRNGDFRYGSRLCENSDAELERRKFVSITLNKKRTALAVTIERRKERKQFCAFSARARFHTAWVKSRPDPPEQGCPLFPRKRTLPRSDAMSVWCHNRTHA